MILRSGGVLLNVQHISYFAVRLSIDDKEIEHRATTLGQLCHQLEQFLLRQSATSLDDGIVIIGYRGQLFIFLFKQGLEAAFSPEKVHRLSYHHFGEPRGQCALPLEAEVCENLDESIVQHIQRVVCISCIAVADGHQLLGIAPIEHLAGSIFSGPTPSYQLLLIFQINHLFLRVFPPLSVS